MRTVIMRVVRCMWNVYVMIGYGSLGLRVTRDGAQPRETCGKRTARLVVREGWMRRAPLRDVQWERVPVGGCRLWLPWRSSGQGKGEGVRAPTPTYAAAASETI